MIEPPVRNLIVVAAELERFADWLSSDTASRFSELFVLECGLHAVDLSRRMPKRLCRRLPATDYFVDFLSGRLHPVCL
jgi:hypothetical protein